MTVKTYEQWGINVFNVYGIEYYAGGKMWWDDWENAGFKLYCHNPHYVNVNTTNEKK